MWARTTLSGGLTPYDVGPHGRCSTRSVRSRFPTSSASATATRSSRPRRSARSSRAMRRRVYGIDLDQLTVAAASDDLSWTNEVKAPTEPPRSLGRAGPCLDVPGDPALDLRALRQPAQGVVHVVDRVPGPSGQSYYLDSRPPVQYGKSKWGSSSDGRRFEALKYPFRHRPLPGGLMRRPSSRSSASPTPTPPGLIQEW